MKPLKIDPKVEASWDKALNPDSLKQHLLTCGIYLAAFEMFKGSLVGRPRDFYCSGFSGGKDTIDAAYEAEMLSLHKHRYQASALWWLKRGAITADDVALANEIRDHRDEIAHDIPRFLGDIDSAVRKDLLDGVFRLISKIDQWWIREVEIPTNPDFDDRELSEAELNGVLSMNMIILSHMIPIAHGDDSRLREFYASWRKRLDELCHKEPESPAP